MEATSSSYFFEDGTRGEPMFMALASRSATVPKTWNSTPHLVPPCAALSDSLRLTSLEGYGQKFRSFFWPGKHMLLSSRTSNPLFFGAALSARKVVCVLFPSAGARATHIPSRGNENEVGRSTRVETRSESSIIRTRFLWGYICRLSGVARPE